MLRRALGTVVLGLAMIGATPAYATGSVSCPPDLPACVVTVETPGTPAQSPTTPVTATSGTPVCVIKRTGLAVPCFDANWVNRPGVSGDSDPWEGWSHVSQYVEEVSGRAA